MSSTWACPQTRVSWKDIYQQGMPLRDFSALESNLQDVGRRIPYAFLEDIKQTFLSKHEEEGREGIAYSLDESFRPILEERMNYFSRSSEADAINRVRGELGQVRGIMIENIDKVAISSSYLMVHVVFPQWHQSHFIQEM